MDSFASPSAVPENREQRRFQVAVPVTVKSPQKLIDQNAHTRDMSIGGVYFYTGVRLRPGLKMELILPLPKQMGLIREQVFACDAKVVRVEEQGHGAYGVGAVIHNYRLLWREKNLSHGPSAMPLPPHGLAPNSEC